MAAAGGGRWEVVRRGRRPAGGSGGRRAAGEANAGRVPAPARECGAAAGGAGRRWRGRGELWGRGRGPVALSPSPRSPRSSRGRGWRRPRAGPGEGGEEAGPGGGGRAGGAAAARREERQEGGGRRRPQARPVPLAGGSAESARRGGPAEGAGQEPEHVPREPLRLGEGPGRLPQLQAAGAQERPCAQPARPRLSVLSCEQRAEEYHQIPAGKVFQRAGALLRPLHLHHAAGAGQDPRGVPARVQDLHPGGAAGQAQNRHREPGQVWLGVMLPVLGIKALSPYAVAYLDRLLMMHPNLTKGFGMIGPKDFFPLLDFAFMPNNSLSPSLQEQLRRLYPRLKVLALGARPEATLHTYFPSFLSRATPSCPPAMRKELLASMSQCLSVDPLSFSVWRQLYTKHLAQSSLLLNHLLESWDNGSRKVRQSLQETVRSFKVTNEELAARGPGSEQDVAACDAACKVLLQKMKGGGFPWSRLLLIGLVFAVGFLLHDVRTHGSLQASTSARVLRSSGILSASQQAWHKASHYSLEGYRWLESTLPACCSRGAAVLQPALQLLWAKTAELALRISELCSSHLSWARDHLPWLLEWLQSRVPEAVLHFAECVRELLLFLLRSCLLPLLEHGAAALQRGWEHCLDACHGEVSWDCLRAQLTSLTYSSWAYLQNTTLAVTNWASAMISGH
uniref:Transmembrane protein 214 n=1 Tax=Cairina moschata TaxID=8855 RepID=A0A8C3GH43_CAIMO